MPRAGVFGSSLALYEKDKYSLGIGVSQCSRCEYQVRYILTIDIRINLNADGNIFLQPRVTSTCRISIPYPGSHRALHATEAISVVLSLETSAISF